MSELGDTVKAIRKTHVLIGRCDACGRTLELVWPEELPTQCESCAECAAERADERRQS